MTAREAKEHIHNLRTQIIYREIEETLNEFNRKWIKLAILQTSGEYNFQRRLSLHSRRTYTRKNKSRPGWFPYNDPLIINKQHGDLSESWNPESQVSGTGANVQGIVAVINSDPRAMDIIRGSGGNDEFIPRPFDRPIRDAGYAMLKEDMAACLQRIKAAWGGA